MKHQYFGDVNDYRKYGLLRTLQRESGLRLGVWWMLTENDGRSDGRFIEYLQHPGRWRRFDPALYESLAATVPVGRSVDAVREHGILGEALFADAVVPDGRLERAATFAAVSERLRDAELVFVDPDNGVEVESCAPGRKDSSKYVLHSELAEIFSAGQSILIYQHFRRQERQAFIQRMAKTFRSFSGPPSVSCFRTPHVAFFLLAQPKHEIRLRTAANRVATTSEDQIQVWFDSPRTGE